MEPVMNGGAQDPIAETLRTYAQNLLVLIFGILPIFFIPSVSAPFEYSKILFVAIGVFSALVLYSLSALRAGGVQMGISYPLIGVWALGLAATISSLLSGDFKDSFLGDVMTTHTSAFLLLLALVMSVWVLVKADKRAVIRLYMLLAVSTVVLVLFHVARLLFGADFLSAGIFMESISSPIGGWNDLALFLGLSVIISLVAIDQLPLTKAGRILFGVVTVLSLAMLAVINFFMVWLVLGVTSLAVIVYSLTKDRYLGGQLPLVKERPFNSVSLIISLVVFVASVLFIIGGAGLGGYIAEKTGITYLEVRPSFEATANIARNVYNDHAFLGIGPNKFSDAWRLYKEPGINSTVFWNTDFLAGNGYVSTFFITMGVLGILLWIFFLGTFLFTGIKMLINGAEQDRLWYFIGVSSFVSAVYIWGMSLLYVPGAVILILGALCMGISITSSRALTKQEANTFSLITNRRTGFIFTLLVIGIIVGSVSGLYTLGKHYAGAQAQNVSMRALQNGEVEAAQTAITKAFSLYQSDVYMRRIGEFEFSRLNAILSIQEPTEEDRAEYVRVIQSGISAAEQARNLDPLDPDNWTLLGNMYSVLMTANIDGVYEKSKEALLKAKELNPKNPLSALNLAVLEGRAGNYEAARSYTQEAIALRPNFTDAFYYLSQIDIATGNVEGAIQSTLSIITLEPQNPVRYYQLGILEAARNNNKNAIAAFEQAIRYDASYANAYYLLALLYDKEKRPADALAALTKVLELNPGNAEIEQAIAVLKSGGTLESLSTVGGSAPALPEETKVSDSNGTVTTDNKPETELVSPVNTVPESNPTTESSQGQ